MDLNEQEALSAGLNCYAEAWHAGLVAIVTGVGLSQGRKNAEF